MDPTVIDYLAVLVAAIAAFVIGAVYYMALRAPWMRAARIDPAASGISVPILITTFIAELLLALVFSLVLGAATFGEFDVMAGLMYAVVFWLGFVLTTLVINQRNQGFGWGLTIIDAIHWLLVFIAMGAIIGWFGPAEATLT